MYVTGRLDIEYRISSQDPLIEDAEHSDGRRNAGILPAPEKRRPDGGVTVMGCHPMLQSSVK